MEAGIQKWVPAHDNNTWSKILYWNDGVHHYKYLVSAHNSIFSNRCTLYSISYTIICNNDMGMIQWQHLDLKV